MASEVYTHLTKGELGRKLLAEVEETNLSEVRRCISGIRYHDRHIC